MTKVHSAEMSWREVEQAIQRGAAAIFPMGSTEEHGPHVPMGDYMLADEMAVRVARITGDIVFPCFPFSYSEYFRHFPGTITMQSDTIFRVVDEVVGCLVDQGFRHIVLFNGHKGNEPTLSHLIRKIRRERGVLVPIVSPFGFALPPALMKELDIVVGHGGEPIGSMWEYLFPGLVEPSRIEDWGTKEFLGLRTSGLGGVVFDGAEVGFPIDMEDITPPSGSLTDPRSPSAEKGRRIVDQAVERMAQFMRWFRTVDSHVKPG
jgi:creatinine amidohydrolase